MHHHIKITEDHNGKAKPLSQVEDQTIDYFGDMTFHERGNDVISMNNQTADFLCKSRRQLATIHVVRSAGTEFRDDLKSYVKFNFDFNNKCQGESVPKPHMTFVKAQVSGMPGLSFQL